MKRLVVALGFRLRWEHALLATLRRSGLEALRPLRWPSWSLGAAYYSGSDASGRPVFVKAHHQAELLQREAEGLRLLADDGWVPALWAVGDAPLAHVVVERLEGRALGSWSRSAPLHQRLAVTRRLIDLVDMLDRRGLVHRDLRPDNLLVEADGDLRLIDLAYAMRGDEDPARDPVLRDPKAADLGDAYRAAADHWDDAASAARLLEIDLVHRDDPPAGWTELREELRSRVGRRVWRWPR